MTAVKAAEFPSVVYCSVSGYGQSGPRRDWPAIDNIVQATSGMMSLGGDPDGPPTRVGFPVVDTLTGQTAAFAILSALLRRERSGEGDLIDVAMFDATIAFMASAVVPWLVTGRALERTGNTGYSGQPTSALFKARDGRDISLGVVQQHQFELLAKSAAADAVARPTRCSAIRTRDARTRWWCRGRCREVLATRDAAEWEQLLSAAGIPCGMVRDIGDAMTLPALDQRGLRIPVSIPGLPLREDVGVLGPGFVSTQAGKIELGPPPALGQHSAEIRAWLAKD